MPLSYFDKQNLRRSSSRITNDVDTISQTLTEIINYNFNGYGAGNFGDDAFRLAGRCRYRLLVLPLAGGVITANRKEPKNNFCASKRSYMSLMDILKKWAGGHHDARL